MEVSLLLGMCKWSLSVPSFAPYLILVLYVCIHHCGARGTLCFFPNTLRSTGFIQRAFLL